MVVPCLMLQREGTLGKTLRRILESSWARLTQLFSPHALTTGESLSALWAMVWGLWVMAPMDTFDTHRFVPPEQVLKVGEFQWGLFVFSIGIGQWTGAVTQWQWLRLPSAWLLFSVWLWLAIMFWWQMPGSLENLIYFVLALSQLVGTAHLIKFSARTDSGQGPSS